MVISFVETFVDRVMCVLSYHLYNGVRELTKIARDVVTLMMIGGGEINEGEV